MMVAARRKKFLIMFFTLVMTIAIGVTYQVRIVSMDNLAKEKEKILHDKSFVENSATMTASLPKEEADKIDDSIAKVKIAQYDLRIAEIERDMKVSTNLFTITILIICLLVIMLFLYTHVHYRSDDCDCTERVDKG